MPPRYNRNPGREERAEGWLRSRPSPEKICCPKCCKCVHSLYECSCGRDLMCENCYIQVPDDITVLCATCQEENCHRCSQLYEKFDEKSRRFVRLYDMLRERRDPEEMRLLTEGDYEETAAFFPFDRFVYSGGKLKVRGMVRRRIIKAMREILKILAPLRKELQDAARICDKNYSFYKFSHKYDESRGLLCSLEFDYGDGYICIPH